MIKPNWGRQHVVFNIASLALLMMLVLASCVPQIVSEFAFRATLRPLYDAMLADRDGKAVPCETLAAEPLDRLTAGQRSAVGTLLITLGCTGRAAQVLPKLTATGGRSELLAYQWGLIAWKQGDMLTAVTFWRQIQDIDRGLLFQARQVKTTDPEQAQRWYEAAIMTAASPQRQAETLTAYIEEMRGKMVREDFRGRLAYLEAYFGPDTAFGHRLGGQDDLWAGNYQSAFKQISQAITLGVADAETWYLLGDAAWQLDDLPTAERAFRAALNAPTQISWRRPWHLDRLATLLRQSGRQAEALPFQEEAVRLNDYYLYANDLSMLYAEPGPNSGSPSPMRQSQESGRWRHFRGAPMRTTMNYPWRPFRNDHTRLWGVMGVVALGLTALVVGGLIGFRTEMSIYLMGLFGVVGYALLCAYRPFVAFEIVVFSALTVLLSGLKPVGGISVMIGLGLIFTVFWVARFFLRTTIFTITREYFLLLALVAVMLITSLLHVGGPAGFSAAFTYVQLFLFFVLVVNLTTTPLRLHALTGVIIFSSTLLATLILLDHLGWLPPGLIPEQTMGLAEGSNIMVSRTAGLWGDANFTALQLTIALPFIMGWWPEAGRIKQVFLLVASGAILVAFTWTFSIGGLLGLSVMLLIKMINAQRRDRLFAIARNVLIGHHRLLVVLPDRPEYSLLSG